MDYNWTLIKKTGQPGIGHAELYKTSADGNNTIAIVSYLPQITNDSSKRLANVCLLFEGDKSKLTDGLFHSIYNDIGDLIKQKEDDFYKQETEKIEYMIVQTLVINKMPEIELLGNGDYTIADYVIK